MSAPAALPAVPMLRTDRLILRERRAQDAEALLATMSDPEAMRWWSRAPFASLAELRDYLADADGGGRAWAITRDEGGDRAIGFVATGLRRPGVAEIGFLLACDASGRGIAREAVSRVLDALFAQGVRRVFADTDPDNLRSNRLLERLGFTCEGRLRAEWETHLGVRDSLIWGLLATEWRG